MGPSGVRSPSPGPDVESNCRAMNHDESIGLVHVDQLLRLAVTRRRAVRPVLPGQAGAGGMDHVGGRSQHGLHVNTVAMASG